MKVLAQGLWLPQPGARPPQSVFPLAGGEAPASCPLGHVLLLGQLCLPPNPIPADCQLVLLPRAGHKAYTRCHISPKGTEPLPLPHSWLRSAWLMLLLNRRSYSRVHPLCVYFLTCGPKRQTSVFPQAQAFGQ